MRIPGTRWYTLPNNPVFRLSLHGEEAEPARDCVQGASVLVGVCTVRVKLSREAPGTQQGAPPPPQHHTVCRRRFVPRSRLNHFYRSAATVVSRHRLLLHTVCRFRYMPRRRLNFHHRSAAAAVPHW